MSYSVAAQDIMTIECDSEAEAKLVKESVNKAYLEGEQFIFKMLKLQRKKKKKKEAV